MASRDTKPETVDQVDGDQEDKVRMVTEGCLIYPQRVKSSVVGINSSPRKCSGERLSVKYIKDTSRV